MTRTISMQRIVDVAAKIFDEQSFDDIRKMQVHFGEAFTQAKIIASIAVGMVARVADLQDDSTARSLPSELDRLIETGLTRLEKDADAIPY